MQFILRYCGLSSTDKVFGETLYDTSFSLYAASRNPYDSWPLLQCYKELIYKHNSATRIGSLYLKYYKYGFQPGFYRNQKTGNPVLFQNLKTGFWLPAKPGFPPISVEI